MIEVDEYDGVQYLYDPERRIDRFEGQYRFLSNFFVLDPPHNPLQRSGLEFRSSEHLYMWHKPYDDTALKMRIVTAETPKEAKDLGKLAKLRPDWDTVKYGIMMACVTQKFKRNPILKMALINTGYSHLIEGNHWGDTVWGMVASPMYPSAFSIGQNHLGKILMLVREKARSGIL
jgi:ribA/ribD-fused uncharacterized protein